jgi:hypothetical protein
MFEKLVRRQKETHNIQTNSNHPKQVILIFFIIFLL